MEYTEFNSGASGATPLVLVHGLGATRRHWDTVAPELARERRVIAVDLPGFGDSPAGESFTLASATSQLARLIDVLELDGCSVIGHSMGGLVALSLARQIPRSLSGIVLVDAQLLTLFDILRRPWRGVCHPVPTAAITAMLLGGSVPGRGAIARSTAGSRAWRRVLYWPVAYRPADLSDSLVRATYSDTTNRGIYGAVAELARVDASALFEDPQVKVVMLWGNNDRLIRGGDTARAARALNNPPMASIPDCGHLPMLERPRDLVRLMTALS